jgi:hypothetical protein
MRKQYTFLTKLFFVAFLKVTDENSRIRIQIRTKMWIRNNAFLQTKFLSINF